MRREGLAMDASQSSSKQWLVKQALWVIFIGLLGGFAWAFSLLGEVRVSPIPVTFYEGFPGAPDRWRSVHLGCLLNGLLALGLVAVLPLFELSKRDWQSLKLGLPMVIWGNTLFYLCGVFAPNHGLSLGDNALGAGSVAGAIGYLSALIAAIALTYIVILLLRAKPAR